MLINKFRLFSLLLIVLCCNTSVYAIDLKAYQDEYVTFEYPPSFQLEIDNDEEGIREIFLAGPKGSDINITVFPFVVDMGLKDIEEIMHQIRTLEIDAGQFVGLGL